MRWQGRRRSDNVDDRRGRTPRRLPRGARGRVARGGSAGGTGRAGGSSLIVFALVALALWVFAGINPLQLIDLITREGSVSVGSSSQPESAAPTGAEAERGRAFVSVVLAETEDTWGELFRADGARYQEPGLVLFAGTARSACGFASAAVGPFYCPRDRNVYIDLAFFDTLARRLGAPGDFAQAYVIAHEVGHHVQNLEGTLQAYHRYRQRAGQRAANEMSVRLELQADCYAGIWAHHADNAGIVEDGDIEEAIRAAAAVGDDTIQRRSQGYVVPETFNHGTADQRARWFRRGFQAGDRGACDTFRGAL